MELNKVIEQAAVNVEGLGVSTKVRYREQIKGAFLVNGGDKENAKRKDYILHFITFFWKVLFAFIPPPHICGGWLCFACSLLVIGLLTAVIGDMASIFGCILGIPDTITGKIKPHMLLHTKAHE
jgi:solute carrier family 8 (sodium/calcium exchanger)